MVPDAPHDSAGREVTGKMNADTNKPTDSEREHPSRPAEEAAARSKDEQIEALREENRELRTDLQDLRDDFEAWKTTFTSHMNDLSAKVDGKDPSDPRANTYYEDLTVLEKYAEMTPSERADLLNGSSSKRRAVEIFRHWEEWSQSVDAGQVITTKNRRGRYNKIALKVDLQSATDEDLQNIEVYRAMKAVAKLSVPESGDVTCTTDEYDHEHITGGAFEFHEKTFEGTRYKVLKLVDPDGVTVP